MNQSFEEVKNEMKKSALKVVQETFPLKIIELECLLKNDPKFSIDFDVTNGLNIIESECKPNVDHPNGETLCESCSTLKRKPANAAKNENDETCWVEAHSNKHLVEMAAILKKELVTFTDSTLTISVGINLMVPKMEDGNNFGVEIQQEVIDTTIGAENDIYQKLFEIHKYFISRAELVTKLVKYPNCEDFKFAIFERDRQFHRFVRISMIALRNHYMALEDIVTKNLNKIKKPKSSVTTDFLYWADMQLSLEM